MNDQAIIQIHKHNTKINRILNKICDKYPGLSEQIDLALYSCLKIQKIIKKHEQQNNFKPSIERNLLKDNGNSNVCLNEQDQLYQNALSVIQGFKGATKRLETKVGILLRQQEISQKVQRAKYHNEIDPYYEVPRQQLSRNCTIKGKKKYTSVYENTSSFSPHIVSFTQSKAKRNENIESGSKKKSPKDKQRKRVQEYINESQSFQQIDETNESRNIQQLDQQIIDLASEIKHIIKGR